MKYMKEYYAKNKVTIIGKIFKKEECEHIVNEMYGISQISTNIFYNKNIQKSQKPYKLN
jgi:hypothetical protein